MRKHPIYGSDLIERTPGVVHLAPAVRAEHERWDGDGYPDGLAGEEIPLASQIVFACDAYHAMVSDRPYRKGLGEEEAAAPPPRRRRHPVQPGGRRGDAGCARAADGAGRAPE